MVTCNKIKYIWFFYLLLNNLAFQSMRLPNEGYFRNESWTVKLNIYVLLQEIVQNPKFIVKDVCDMDVEPGKIGKLGLCISLLYLIKQCVVLQNKICIYLKLNTNTREYNLAN